MKFPTAAIVATVVVSIDGALATGCKVTVCNRTPGNWIKVGAVKSAKLNGYKRVGAVKRNQCATVQHDAPEEMLKVERGTREMIGLFSKNKCGCTFNVCGHKVINRSSRKIEAWIPALDNTIVPIKILPGKWKIVAGSEGQPIHVRDAATKKLYKKYSRNGCGKTVVVKESDCGPKPTTSPTSPPTYFPTAAPSGVPTATPASVTSTEPPAGTRSGDKCEPACGSLTGCYLFDFNTGSEVPLVVEDSATVIGAHNLSVRCETSGLIGHVEFVDMDGAVMHEDSAAPYWILGRSAADGTVGVLPPMEPCQSLEFSFHGYMNVDDADTCFEETFVLKGDCSEHPTVNPSTAPTGSPSASPTTSPSQVPSLAPTPSPTKSPTANPSEPPSKDPTASPTPSPTASPSAAPTEFPTKTPTKPPTNSPTKTPTTSPTKTPTQTRSGDKPTLSPTCVDDHTPTTTRSGELPTEEPKQCTIPSHPRMCYLWSTSLRFWDPVPKGTKIELYTVQGQKFKYTSSGIKSSTVTNVPMHKFYSRPFYMRFTNECGSSIWTLCKNYTPIGLDIDHSGAVEHIAGKFKIDITGDGEINDLQEWFAPTEGILIDTSHGIDNGVVTGQHLFGDEGGMYADGFDKLEEHDDNGDGEIKGPELDGFMIWTDANSNTIVDDGELSTLGSHGIVSLHTMHKDMVSHATLDDGSTMRMEDLWFSR